jgi:outer membrane protein assembly factor BamD
MISKFKVLLILTSFLFFLSCADKEKKISEIIEVDMELQMSNAYKEGYAELQRGDVLLAAKKFNEAELLFPQSPWAAKSAIMAAYAYYIQDYYSDAIFELERYLATYPNDKDQVYAHFLMGVSFYEQIVDEKKDLKSILESKMQFELIINEYPDTKFAADAKFKIDLINEILAAKEMYLARYYLNKTMWIPALN